MIEGSPPTRRDIAVSIEERSLESLVDHHDGFYILISQSLRKQSFSFLFLWPVDTGRATIDATASPVGDGDRPRPCLSCPF
jgi:hypothetical protein